MRKRFWKFGEKSMAGLPKRLFTWPDERFQTKHFVSEIIVFVYQPLTFGDKIVTSGKNFGQVGSQFTLRVPGNNFKEKSFFQNSSTFPSFPPHPEKIKFRRRIFGRVVKIPFYVIKRRFSGKPILFREKLYVLITFGNSNKITQIFLKKIWKLSTLNYICRVERHSWSFSLWKKIYSHHFFRILTDEISKPRIKNLKGFQKPYSTCPDTFNQIKHVCFPKKVYFNESLFSEFYWKNIENLM